MIEIRPFQTRDQPGVLELILYIQREEFGLPITAGQQPDLHTIPTFYQQGKGEFLVAVSNNQIVGTAALKDIGNDYAALRKMFVAEPFRGGEYRLGARLLSELLTHASDRGLFKIFLGTTEKFLAAHRFYEKHGFRQIAPQELPSAFPRMNVDNRFYVRRLHQPTTP